MRASSLVARIFPELEKVLDVEMPRLEVGAHRAFAFAPLINCYCSVVGDFEEGDDALAFAVGPFDGGSCSADIRPVIADAAGPFGELCIVGDDFEDMAAGRPSQWRGSRS